MLKKINKQKKIVELDKNDILLILCAWLLYLLSKYSDFLDCSQHCKAAMEQM